MLQLLAGLDRKFSRENCWILRHYFPGLPDPWDWPEEQFLEALEAVQTVRAFQMGLDMRPDYQTWKAMQDKLQEWSNGRTS
ncbi:MAG: hypothetical protein PHI18_10520 [bacterium]|nr:hypothetical protein [bacterium]